MRAAPDLLSLGNELPDLEELLPEEVKYLCDVCELLSRYQLCSSVRRYAQIDTGLFDADELGLDPEEDQCHS